MAVSSQKLNAHLVSYLASRGCEFNGYAFHSKSGSYARVFLGVSEGWLAERADGLSAEVIAEHLDEITNLDGFWIPTTTQEPTERVDAQLDAILGPATA